MKVYKFLCACLYSILEDCLLVANAGTPEEVATLNYTELFKSFTFCLVSQATL